MAFVTFIIILAVLILVHELGHFLVAKKQGVLVEEFGVGFPPRIIAKKIGETIYSLNIIPLGGFVKLFGEEYHELTGQKNQSNLKKSRAFVSKKPYQKFAIIVAGVVGNFILGWLIITILFTQGIPKQGNKALVDKIIQGSPAEAAGLKKKDLIYGIKYGNKIYNFRSVEDFIYLAKKYSGKEIILLLARNQNQLAIKVVPRKNPPKGQGPVGVVISSNIEIKKYPWYQAPFYGILEAFDITRKIIIALFKTVIGVFTFQKADLDISGPIGIARYTGEVVKFGTKAVLELLALLSLNLAVVNILPFPALDGGRLVFVTYEWITRKKFDRRLEKYLNLAGFIILIGLAIIISLSDIIKIYR